MTLYSVFLGNNYHGCVDAENPVDAVRAAHIYCRLDHLHLSFSANGEGIESENNWGSAWDGSFQVFEGDVGDEFPLNVEYVHVDQAVLSEDEIVHAAEDLDDLRDRLHYIRRHADLDHLSVDMSDLPVFGGDEPDDTDGIWSWDKNKLLVGETADEIVRREEYAKRRVV